MRIDLQKFLFVGAEAKREHFFVEAQKLGIIHFIDPKAVLKDLSPGLKNMIAAIKVLRSQPVTEQDDMRDFSRGNEIADKVVSLRNEQYKFDEEERVTDLEIARVAPFGNFSFEDIDYIEKTGKRTIQFFTAKEGTAQREDLPEELIFVGFANGLDHFIAINKEPTQYTGFSEVKIEKTASELRSDLASIKLKRHRIESHLKKLAKYNDFLHEALIQEYNAFNLQTSEKAICKPLDNHLFAVSGWVPVDKLDEMHHLTDQTDVFVEQVEVEPNEIMPTFLENYGNNRIGQDLVGIYDTPSSTDKDPSTWVLASFAFFFAMIVADAGYGVVFFLIALYLRYKYPNLKGLGYRVWKLVMILSVTCIIWGVAISSYFGISLHSQNPLRKVSLMNYFVEKKAEYHFNAKDEVFTEFEKEYPDLKTAKTPKEFLHITKIEKNGRVVFPVYGTFTDNILFELALFVGLIHIIISLLRYVGRNWAAVGWVIFMIGAYLYLPNYLNATSFLNFGFDIPKSFGAENGPYLMIAGFFIATILAFIQHKFKGMLEPMTLIQIFADTMSYLRIYALSLAGAMVAATINEFATGTVFIVSALMFVLGHIINIALSIMGGVIHGLRLIFIEWYHYSFEGGGKSFNPLRLLEKDKE
jgi:V/A-type H+/Na+-transporting ATPase subunit I